MFAPLRRPLAWSVWFLLLGMAVPRGGECAEDAPGVASLASASVEQVAQSPGYADAPVWRLGMIHFSGSGFWRLQPEGPVKVLDLNPSGSCVRDQDDVLLCGSSINALLNISPEGKIHVLADTFEGQPLKSLNDVTIDGLGRIYWTDPAGSSQENPVGKVFRLTADGKIQQLLGNLAFPAGIEVDPTGKLLVVVESQTNRILKYEIPENEGEWKAPVVLYDLGGAGGDGCAFDAQGNLWVADFHQKETGRGRLTVVSPTGGLVGQVEIPAKVVSNLAFGGEKFDEVYCTTAEPPGLYRVRAGVEGFRGHRAAQVTFVKEVDVKTLLNLKPIKPRKLSRLERKRLRNGKGEPKLGLPRLPAELWNGTVGNRTVGEFWWIRSY